jgi:hypothetical protein
VADLSSTYPSPDPVEKSRPWRHERYLTTRFLRDVLIDPRYRSATTPFGIRIAGARISEPVDFSVLATTIPISFLDTRFDSDVNLYHFSTSSDLFFSSTYFDGDLDLTALRANFVQINDITAHSISFDSANLHDVLLIDTRANSINFGFARINNALVASQIEIANKLSLSNTNARYVSLAGRSEILALAGAHVTGDMILQELFVHEGLLLNPIKVDGNLFLGYYNSIEHTTPFIEMGHSSIGGLVDLSGYTIWQYVAVCCSTIGADLLLDHTFVGGDVDAIGIHITGDLVLKHSFIAGVLYTEDADVERSFKGGGNNYGALSSRGAKFGDVDISNMTFRGPIDLSARDVDLTYATIKGGLLMSGEGLPPVNLTGAQIGQELTIGADTTWLPNSRLVLRNATAHALYDYGPTCKSDAECPSSWPPRLDLIGFSYSEIGSHGARNEIVVRSGDQWNRWLQRQEPFSHEPYQQLASTLQKTGMPEVAEDVLFYSHDRDRVSAYGARRIWLELYGWIAGYGYRTYWAFGWAAIFIFVGSLVLRISGEGRRNGIPYGITYSFDLFLPVAELSKKHYDIELKGWARYYFYVHKLSGYVLAFFILAALADLVPKV